MKTNEKQIDNDGIMYLSLLDSELGFASFKKGDDLKALTHLQQAFEYLNEYYSRIKPEQDSDGKIRESMKQNLYEVIAKIFVLCDRLGDAKTKAKDFSSAIDYYKQAIFYNSKDGTLFYKIGKCLLELESNEAALISFEKALEFGYQGNDIYMDLGELYLSQRNDPLKAIEAYKKYLEKNPRDCNVYNMLGHSYETFNAFENIDLQIDYFKKAFELNPSYCCPLKNLTIVCPRAERYEEALEYFQKLLKLRTSMTDNFDYGCFLIKMKNFEQGWKYYESRFLKETDATPYPIIKKPKWKGQKMNNQSLLVHWEQGFGDTINFVRYIWQLKEFSNNIIFKVQDSMIDLMKSNLEGIEIVGDSTPLEDLKFNMHVPLVSLMHHLNARIDNIPLSQDYIKADKEKSAYYKKTFFNNDCFKIGISWQGAKIGNPKRNIPIEAFYPLAKIQNVKIYSFQKEIDNEIFNNLPEGVEIIDLAPTFHDFSDTAAALDNVDLFISSDNCLPNLAGAMGKKTYFMLNKDCEWRWFNDGNTTPWYDSFKVFRKQKENDSWDLLIEDIIKNHLPTEMKAFRANSS